MIGPIDELDAWLRGNFVRVNTALEEVYFAERVDVVSSRPGLDALKRQLVHEGGTLVERVAAQALPEDPRARYRLLGLVGHYLAACRRHEAPLSDATAGRDAAWRVSSAIGSALGVAPRLVFAHQSLFNEAIAGRFRTFTSFTDEEIFIRYNALGVLAYRRTANALRDIAGIGISSAVSSYLLDEAETALRDVLRFNQELARQLNVDRFFWNIRPYFKTYRVGDTEHRGFNAGDFAAINEIDVILGVCRMDDPFYQSIVREKFPFVPPEDQPHLLALERRTSLLDAFLRELDAGGATLEWQANAARFLAVCKAHGAAYAFHHQRLVKPYLEMPAAAAPATHSAGVTSSGPPLGQVIAMLQRLLDLRLGRHADGSVAASLARLHGHAGAGK